MGALITRVKLREQISLTNWDVTEDGVDINGTYNYISFPSPITSFPLEGTESGVTYNLYASENGSEYSLIYSGGTPVVQGYKHSSLESYMFYDGSQWALWFDGTYQWVNPNGEQNILPLNNWQIYVAQGPAGNIQITDSSIKNISFLVKKTNSVGGKITIKPNNLFTCPFEVDTFTCPSIGFSDSGWYLASNTSRIGKTTAPDGSNTAVEYESLATGGSFVSQGFLQYWRPFTRYEFSIWAKSTLGVPTDGQIVNVTKDGGSDRVIIDAVGNLTSTWQKFTITFTTGPSMNSYITAFFCADITAGVRFALWGAEMYRYT